MNSFSKNKEVVSICKNYYKIVNNNSDDKFTTNIVKIYKDFIFNIQNRSQKLSNYSYTKNYVITERTGEMDVIKLKNWDKENLIHIQLKLVIKLMIIVDLVDFMLLQFQMLQKE